VLEYWASHDDNCKLKTVGSWYATSGYGVGFPKGSRWIDKVNKYMIDFQHNGTVVIHRTKTGDRIYFVKIKNLFTLAKRRLGPI